jgi:uncharacterized protein YodC (DUF2158 family)
VDLVRTCCTTCCGAYSPNSTSSICSGFAVDFVAQLVVQQNHNKFNFQRLFYLLYKLIGDYMRFKLVHNGGHANSATRGGPRTALTSFIESSMPICRWFVEVCRHAVHVQNLLWIF